MDHRHNTPQGWDNTAEDYDVGHGGPTESYAVRAIELANVEPFLTGPSAKSQVTFLDIAGGIFTPILQKIKM